MRKIEVKKWTAIVKDYERDTSGNISMVVNGKPKIVDKEVEENTSQVLEALIKNKKPEDMPRGLSHFRTFNRLAKAFDKADKSGVIELDESDYLFLKDTIEKEIPSIWGSNQNYADAITSFLDAKSE